MKLSATLLLVIFVPSTDALFFGLFSGVFDRLAGRICTAGIAQLQIDDQVTCDCSGDFSFIPFGVTASADCDTESICLQDGLFCGEAEITADFGIGDGFSGAVGVCLEIVPDLGLPDDLEDLFETTFCISGTAQNEFALTECTATLGGECECVPCADGLGVDVDCSMVNINPLGENALQIDGPNPGCLDIALGNIV